MKYIFKFNITKETSFSDVTRLKAQFEILMARYNIKCDLRFGPQGNRIVVEGCDDILEHHNSEVDNTCTLIKKIVHEYQPADEMACLEQQDAMLIIILDDTLDMKIKVLNYAGVVLKEEL